MIRILEMEKMSGDERSFICQRSRQDMDNVRPIVSQIIEDVRANGDSAVRKYTKKFDGVNIESFRISRDEIDDAWTRVDGTLTARIKEQIGYSERFHKMQIRKDWKKEFDKGIVLGEKITPIESVGLYVPGGRAAYPTVLQILAVPAKLAGVPRIAVFTPPNKEGKVPDVILATADILGVDEIYKIGGAQAIAAMSYGTQTIKPVRKIVGPGNIYVNCAKMLCFGVVDIDMLAGPSEALILADSSAKPVFAAADMLARCEHDPNASAVLLTDSTELAKKVRNEIKRQFSYLNRKEIMRESLSKYSAIIISDDWDDLIKFTNDYAPEHLEIMMKDPWAVLDKIVNAGSIFLGNYAPVAIGDYASGANHVLPTGQCAKMFSPVGVETFQKRSEFQFISREGLGAMSPIVRDISKIEGLDAHYNSIDVRL